MNGEASKPSAFWSPLKVASVCCGAVLLWLGANLAASSVKSSHRNEIARTAEPLRMSLDLSKTGTYTGRLNQVTSHTCKQTLTLEAQSVPKDYTNLFNSLAGLQGRMIIAVPDTKPVLDRKFSAATLFESRSNPGTNFATSFGFYLNPFPRASYEVTVIVESPAPALAGMGQALVGHYELCGLENLRTSIPAAMASGSLVLGFALSTPAIRFLANKSRRPSSK